MIEPLNAMEGLSGLRLCRPSLCQPGLDDAPPFSGAAGQQLMCPSFGGALQSREIWHALQPAMHMPRPRVLRLPYINQDRGLRCSTRRRRSERNKSSALARGVGVRSSIDHAQTCPASEPQMSGDCTGRSFQFASPEERNPQRFAVPPHPSRTPRRRRLSSADILWCVAHESLTLFG